MTIVYIIGFLAQIFFSARILVQWILSEKAKEIVSPSIFWVLSIAGSYLLFIYGWCRDDFSIILGQIISFLLYLYLESECQRDMEKHKYHIENNTLHNTCSGLCFPSGIARTVYKPILQKRGYSNMATRIRLGRTGYIHPEIYISADILIPQT